MTKERLKEEHKELLTVYLALFPKLPAKDLVKWFECYYPGVLTPKKVYEYKYAHRKEIGALRENENLLKSEAKRLGVLSLDNKVARVVLLEQLAFKCINGFETDRIDPSGGVQTISNYDHKTGLEAIKAIKEEIGQEETEEVKYEIIIKTAKVNNRSEEIEGDEDL